MLLSSGYTIINRKRYASNMGNNKRTLEELTNELRVFVEGLTVLELTYCQAYIKGTIQGIETDLEAYEWE